MSNSKRLGMVVLVLGLATLWLGCQKQSDVEHAKKSKPKIAIEVPDHVGKETGKEQPTTEKPPKPAEPPKPLTMPKVTLTQQQKEACLVQVGDRMPEAELAGLDGKRQPLRALYGPKLTVVLFWKSDNLYATQALENLQSDVAEPYRAKGVRVVGISVGDSPEAAKKAVEEGKVQYPNLLDPDASYTSKVAKEKLPRVYLVDGAGKILYFDVEYSSTTQRQLATAIKVALGEK